MICMEASQLTSLLAPCLQLVKTLLTQPRAEVEGYPTLGVILGNTRRMSVRVKNKRIVGFNGAIKRCDVVI